MRSFSPTRPFRFHSWYPRFFAILTVLAVLPWLGMAVLAAQADSGAVIPPVTEPGQALTILQLVGWGAGILGAWLFKKWNVSQGKLDGISNFLKQAAATALVTVIGVIVQKLGTVMTGTTFDLTQAGFTNFLVGIGTTVLVGLGIGSAKEKARAPSVSRPI